MGCGPSRATIRKVGDNRNDYNRCYLQEFDKARRKQKQSLAKNRRKLPTYSKFSSTTKTYDLQSRMSTITVRLSTDGSMLEIEQFDLIREKAEKISEYISDTSSDTASPTCQDVDDDADIRCASSPLLGSLDSTDTAGGKGHAENATEDNNHDADPIYKDANDIPKRQYPCRELHPCGTEREIPSTIMLDNQVYHTNNGTNVCSRSICTEDNSSGQRCERQYQDCQNEVTTHLDRLVEISRCTNTNNKVNNTRQRLITDTNANVLDDTDDDNNTLTPNHLQNSELPDCTMRGRFTDVDNEISNSQPRSHSVTCMRCNISMSENSKEVFDNDIINTKQMDANSTVTVSKQGHQRINQDATMETASTASITDNSFTKQTSMTKRPSITQQLCVNLSTCCCITRTESPITEVHVSPVQAIRVHYCQKSIIQNTTNTKPNTVHSTLAYNIDNSFVGVEAFRNSTEFPHLSTNVTVSPCFPGNLLHEEPTTDLQENNENFQEICTCKFCRLHGVKESHDTPDYCQREDNTYAENNSNGTESDSSIEDEVYRESDVSEAESPEHHTANVYAPNSEQTYVFSDNENDGDVDSSDDDADVYIDALDRTYV